MRVKETANAKGKKIERNPLYRVSFSRVTTPALLCNSISSSDRLFTQAFKVAVAPNTSEGDSHMYLPRLSIPFSFSCVTSTQKSLPSK